jgi:hypothetical protein
MGLHPANRTDPAWPRVVARTMTEPRDDPDTEILTGDGPGSDSGEGPDSEAGEGPGSDAGEGPGSAGGGGPGSV